MSAGDEYQKGPVQARMPTKMVPRKERTWQKRYNCRNLAGSSRESRHQASAQQRIATATPKKYFLSAFLTQRQRCLRNKDSYFVCLMNIN